MSPDIKIPRRKYTTDEKNYLILNEKLYNIHTGKGVVIPYRMMNYQKEFHADCILCHPHDYRHRIKKKARGIGATLEVTADLLNCAKRFENTVFPVSSTGLRAASTVIDWARFLADNANYDFCRDKNVNEFISFPHYNTRIQKVPGNNPYALLSIRTPFLVFDELAYCRYQAELKDAGRRLMSEGGQENDISTVNTNVDQFWDTLSRWRELGYNFYNHTLFPSDFYKGNQSIFDIIDQEYYEYYNEGNYKKMRDLCNLAWNAGLWKLHEIEIPPEYKELKYYGLWPEDRGLIPLAPWIRLEELEEDRILDIISFVKNNLGIISEGTGALLPLSLLESASKMKVHHRMDTVIANEVKGEKTSVYTGGWDFGGKVHYAAISIFKENYPLYQQVYSQVFFHLDTEAQQQRMAELLELFPGLYCIGVDATGAGTTFAEWMRHNFQDRVYVAPLIMNKKVPTELRAGAQWEKTTLARQAAYNFRMGLLNGTIEILDDQTIHKDANMIQAEDLSAGIRREKHGVTHADRTWASICAIYGPKTMPSQVVQLLRGGKSEKAMKTKQEQQFLQQFPVSVRSKPRIPKRKDSIFD